MTCKPSLPTYFSDVGSRHDKAVAGIFGRLALRLDDSITTDIVLNIFKASIVVMTARWKLIQSRDCLGMQ